MRGGASGPRDSADDTRGVSPQVGFVLLVGMVFIGASLVAISGWMLIDSLEGEAEAEVTYSAIEATDYGIESAARTGQLQSISEEGTYRNEGTVSIIWWDEDPNTNKSVDDQPLGAIEFDVLDGTAAHQGGGTWAPRDGGYYAESPPPIGYDDDGVLEVRLVSLDASDVSGNDPTARPDPNSNLPQEIDNLTENATNAGYNNLTLEIESKYHTGWEDYFESDLKPNHPNDPGEVEVNSNGNTVELRITNVTDTQSHFWVKNDNGLAGGGPYANENTFIEDQYLDLELEVDIENTGSEQDQQDIELDVIGTTASDIEPDLELDGGEEDDVTLGINDHENYFDYGELYEYNIETEDDDFDEYGSFRYAKQEDPYLIISNVSVDYQDATDSENPVNATEDNVTISADIRNGGARNASDREIQLELEHRGDGSYESTPTTTVDRNFGENAMTEWELNRSSLHQGTHNVTISAVENDGEQTRQTGYFNITDGIESDTDEVILPSGTDVNVTIVGTEMSNSNPYEGANGATAYVPDDAKHDGRFTTEGDGTAYSFDAPYPDHGEDELEQSNDGGWVSPDGTEPTATWDCREYTWYGSCADEGYIWAWDIDELEWNDDEGYELTWYQDQNNGDWEWTGPIKAESTSPADIEVGVDYYEIDWLPASADIVTQRVDENNEPLEDPETVETSFTGDNLNRFDEPRPLYRHNFTTDDRVSFMISAASHNWQSEYDMETETEIFNGDFYQHIEYRDGAVQSDDVLVDLTADTETDETNVRVLGANETAVPELDPGIDRQEAVDDLLERPGVDVPVDEDGELNLRNDDEMREFVFVFTLTHHPEQYNTNPTVDSDISPDEYWDLAHDQAGDPNFNDMIAHVEFSIGGETAEIDYESEDGDGNVVEPGAGDSDSETPPIEDGDVDVGSDEIIIGG